MRRPPCWLLSWMATEGTAPPGMKSHRLTPSASSEGSAERGSMAMPSGRVNSCSEPGSVETKLEGFRGDDQFDGLLAPLRES